MHLIETIISTFGNASVGLPRLRADGVSAIIERTFLKMPPKSLEQIIPMLQVAIGPVILISGVGLLLLTLTNRLGRAIDRARQLKSEVPKRADPGPVLAQVAILYRRARMVRLSITLAALSALLASALIITLFVTVLLHWEQTLPVVLLFIACMTALFFSLVAFIWDINLSLHALKLELQNDKLDAY
jgi:uncharacterized membrane protein YqjE